MWLVAETNSAPGDSGGPVYTIEGHTNGQLHGKILGHVLEKAGRHFIYQPTDKVIFEHNIIPATN